MKQYFCYIVYIVCAVVQNTEITILYLFLYLLRHVKPSYLLKIMCVLLNILLLLPPIKRVNMKKKNEIKQSIVSLLKPIEVQNTSMGSKTKP